MIHRHLYRSSAFAYPKSMTGTLPFLVTQFEGQGLDAEYRRVTSG
jgi:hypothetical protein